MLVDEPDVLIVPMMAYDLVLSSNPGMLKLTGLEASCLNCGRRLGIPEMSKLSLRYPKEMEVRKTVLVNHPQLYISSSWGPPHLTT